MLESLRVVLGAIQVVAGSHGDIHPSQAVIMEYLLQPPPARVAELNTHDVSIHQEGPSEPDNNAYLICLVSIAVGLFGGGSFLFGYRLGYNARRASEPRHDITKE